MVIREDYQLNVSRRWEVAASSARFGCQKSTSLAGLVLVNSPPCSNSAWFDQRGAGPCPLATPCCFYRCCRCPLSCWSRTSPVSRFLPPKVSWWGCWRMSGVSSRQPRAESEGWRRRRGVKSEGDDLWSTRAMVLCWFSLGLGVYVPVGRNGGSLTPLPRPPATVEGVSNLPSVYYHPRRTSKRRTENSPTRPRSFDGGSPGSRAFFAELFGRSRSPCALPSAPPTPGAPPARTPCTRPGKPMFCLAEQGAGGRQTPQHEASGVHQVPTIHEAA